MLVEQMRCFIHFYTLRITQGESISFLSNIKILPFRYVPLSRAFYKIIAIRFVNKNHFIEVYKTQGIQIML